MEAGWVLRQPAPDNASLALQDQHPSTEPVQGGRHCGAEVAGVGASW